MASSRSAMTARRLIGRATARWVVKDSGCCRRTTGESQEVISCVALYFNYSLDESYTPKQIVLRAGTGPYDLREVGAAIPWCRAEPSSQELSLQPTCEDLVQGPYGADWMALPPLRKRLFKHGGCHPCLPS
eukprot:scaffold1806_cov240-Pinguiococcus_pyrenoidosus.AAC.36